jgi:23S rRNA (guanosine2251-2'-O)-methyltransferase
VWVSRDVDPDDAVDEIAELAGAALRYVSPEQLAGEARTDAPQGVVARADPLPEADLDALLAETGAFLVALDGVTDPRNLGAVMRSAETAGATGVVLAKHRSARLTPTAMKAAAGAAEHLPVARVGGIPAALDRARRAEVWAIGLDEAGDRDIGGVELATERLVLVLGAEGGGLAALTKRRCDVLARIPTYGHIASLNVAAAAAVACHEIARRRAEPTT